MALTFAVDRTRRWTSGVSPEKPSGGVSFRARCGDDCSSGRETGSALRGGCQVMVTIGPTSPLDDHEQHRRPDQCGNGRNDEHRRGVARVVVVKLFELRDTPRLVMLGLGRWCSVRFHVVLVTLRGSDSNP